MDDGMRQLIRESVHDAMVEGRNLALDSAVRVIGMMVECYTLTGHPSEALGASAAMELVKELRKEVPALFATSPDILPEVGK